MQELLGRYGNTYSVFCLKINISLSYNPYYLILFYYIPSVSVTPSEHRFIVFLTLDYAALAANFHSAPPPPFLHFLVLRKAH